MGKGSYRINMGGGGRGGGSDNSFKICLCSLLVFCAICALFSILFFILNSNKSDNDDIEIFDRHSDGNSYGQYVGVYRDRDKISTIMYKQSSSGKIDYTSNMGITLPISLRTDQTSDTPMTTISDNDVKKEYVIDIDIRKNAESEKYHLETTNILNTATTEINDTGGGGVGSTISDTRKKRTTSMDTFATLTNQLDDDLNWKSTTQLYKTVSKTFKDYEKPKRSTEPPESITSPLINTGTTSRHSTTTRRPSTISGSSIDISNTTKIHSTTSSKLHVMKKPNQSCPKPSPVCDSLICKTSARKMISYMDFNIDPCDNFYEYTCGSVKFMNNIDPEEEILNSLPDIDDIPATNEYIQKMKQFYSNCMEYRNGRGVIDVAQILKDLHDITLSTDESNKQNDLTDLIANILLTHPHRSTSRLMPLFDVNIDIGIDHKFLATLTLPMFNSILGDADGGDIYERECRKIVKKQSSNENDAFKIYENYRNCLTNQTNYVKLLEKSITILQIYDHLPDFNKTQEIRKILAFIEWNILDELGSLSPFEEIKYLNGKDYKKIDLTISELSEKYPEINWERFFNIITKGKSVNHVRILYPDKIEKIFNFYRNNALYDIKSALFVMIAHDLYVDYVRPLTTCDREKYCRKITSNFMPDIINSLYFKHIKTPDLEHTIKTSQILFNQTIQKLSASFETVSWLTITEIKDIILKLNKIKFHGNCQDVYSQDIKLFEKYKQITITDNFVTNVFMMKKLLIRDGIYEKLGQNVDNLENICSYFSVPSSMKPKRIHPLNMIIFPLALTSKYIHRKRKSLQKYEEFSKLEYLMAREIFHFFDTSHITEILRYENEAFKSYIDTLSIPEITKQENPFNLNIYKNDIISTLDNRFVDESALRLSYETYTEFYLKYNLTEDLPYLWLNFTIPQLFYINLAQQFCDNQSSKTALAISLFENFNLPNYFRVNSMFMNSIHFANVFDCRHGSSMNPAFKIDQFPFITPTEIDYFRDIDDGKS